MAPKQSQRKATHDSLIDVANASAPKDPVTPHAVATSCGLSTCRHARI